MRALGKWSLVLAVLAVWGTPARPAEGKRKWVPEEGATQVLLLRQKSIQDELKLTADEAKKIDDFTSQQWHKAVRADDLPPEERDQKFEEMSEENERFLGEILEPQQRKRLDEITMQIAGLLWVTQPKIAEQLNLTDAQKQKARQLQQEAREEMREIIHDTKYPEREAKHQKHLQECRRRLEEILTDEQEKKWDELNGEPFTGKLDYSDVEKPRQ